MWYVRDVLYAVLHVRCFVVRGCAVSRRYINVCNCDMFSVVYVYLDYLKFCVLMVKGMSVVVNVIIKLPYVRYYVGVKSSFQHAREECESKRAYMF